MSQQMTSAGSELEDLWIRNEESMSKTVRLSVHRRSEQQEAIVDSYYEVPGNIVITFPDILRHGTEYRFKVVPSQAIPSTKTLTATGCGENSEAPEGENPIVIDVTESEPSILFKGCDVAFSATRARADQYRVEKSAATGGTSDESTTPT